MNVKELIKCVNNCQATENDPNVNVLHQARKASVPLMLAGNNLYFFIEFPINVEIKSYLGAEAFNC